MAEVTVVVTSVPLGTAAAGMMGAELVMVNLGAAVVAMATEKGVTVVARMVAEARSATETGPTAAVRAAVVIV
eukprot:4253386-Prymnesium_polylepis.1